MGIFEHETGNKHFKFPGVNADWTGLTRRTFFHEKQCWPMFGCLAFSIGIMAAYMVRLASQKDQIVNRSKQVTHKGDPKTQIQMHNNNYRYWDKINPQLKKPHLDDYEIRRSG